jgi:hypothetical protein
MPADEAKQARIASYNESLGLRVLHWLLLIAMHDPNAATYIANAGISPAAIDRVVFTALETIDKFGILDVQSVDCRLWHMRD